MKKRWTRRSCSPIKLSGASNRTRHFWPPFCLLFRARACEKTWVQAKTINQSDKSILCCLFGGVRQNVWVWLQVNRTPRQNECAGLSHARIVSTREGLVPIKFAMGTTTRQNGGNLNSLCLFSFYDDKDNTTLIRFKF